MPGVDECVSRVEISVAGKNLRDMDIIGKSDPFAILYTRVDPVRTDRNTQTRPVRNPSRGAFNELALGAGWVEAGRTETIKNNLNPEFVKSFDMAYFFERNQELRIEMYDRDTKSDSHLNRHDYLGGAELTLAELVASPGQRLVRPLLNERNPRGRQRGDVILTVEEQAGLKKAISLDLRASKIKAGIIGGSLFLTVSRAREGADAGVQWVKVYASKPVKKSGSLGYDFAPFKISSAKLNNGDPQRPLKLELFSHASSGNHKLRGVVETSEAGLLALVDEHTGEKSPASAPLPIKLAGKTVGDLVVNRAVSKPVPTFLDYIFGGCDMELLVGIDFTASNGDPRKAGTLHFNDPGGPNEYEAAIRGVTHILGPYDSDQMIPAYGYGAKLPPHNVVSHCFALNGNPGDPNCHGPEGVMAAYRQALNNVTLSGPTIFAQILSLASTMANKKISQDSQAYTILLIITDGIISDMKDTIDEVVTASDLPLSIVIVGVGGADFTAMEQLDADDTPLTSQAGRRMQRDIVQFVPFRQFQAAPGLLAEQVLAEIPDQMLDFMHAKQITPNPPKPALVQKVSGIAVPISEVDTSGQSQPMQGNPTDYAPTTQPPPMNPPPVPQYSNGSAQVYPTAQSEEPARYPAFPVP
eukprot:CAMPEP_0198328632 /NCGR_PEP_ID=MMETSP1450-20131203/15593_1 /TAXON_ID=753684 ORGANISM="Madagascaria erythrocladiodes, Strain CCMP3234" /NCGR_SAMPLE_ID=MMETSP1450 /ASSEMBLY_ACC=CAM_ASM_001115 /LENGTH=639 /DNA_ID=CAMNT_0044032779 /DNA_START=165 /DNA_END=2084 /DNA_ORIENTATION=+